MIFKVVCRADGGDLAHYLLSPKNEQVRVLDLYGTIPNEKSPVCLRAALRDFDELAKMTRGRKTIVHLAINPSDHDRMSDKDWELAIQKAESALGLSGQPRAVVSHVTNGKEHLHVAWSRVDVERGVCIQMSHSKLKCVKAARELELELGLHRMPERARGMARAQKLQQTLLQAQKYQNVRSSHTVKDRQAILETAWHQSVDGHDFKKAIEQAGYKLAIGNRGVLVVDENLEAHSIARNVKGIRLKDVRSKLDCLSELPLLETIREPHRQSLVRRQSFKLTRDAWNVGYPTIRGREPEMSREP